MSDGPFFAVKIRKPVKTMSTAVNGLKFIILTDKLNDPSCADPHAGWCGEGELTTPLYPISFVFNWAYNYIG